MAKPANEYSNKKRPVVSIVMGSQSDYEILGQAEQIMIDFSIDYEIQVVSAHRTPTLMYKFAQEATKKGVKVIIAGAGGSAHLPGMISALTILPVLAVPIESKILKGLDSLLSIVQMPAGVPTATFAIGTAGATNAALFALQILSLEDEALSKKLLNFRSKLGKKALAGNDTVQQRLKEKKEMKTIGIIGGGQLGMLLTMSIKKLGGEVLVYDPDPYSPACLIAPSINSSWQDKEALRLFLSKCYRATYEFENVSYESLATLEQSKIIIPSIDVLCITQNRAKEKEFLASQGLPHVPYIRANDASELIAKITNLEFPVIIKSTTGGYDGKSQLYFRTKDELQTALSQSDDRLPAFPVIAEQAINLHMEVSCITACSLDKEQIVFPVLENVHNNHILDTTVVPANISSEISAVIQNLASQATNKLKLEGILCTEFFISHRSSQKENNINSAYRVGDFNLYINEFAPRPHNSGHVTIASCTASQFDILACILLDLPVTKPILSEKAYFCMANLLGDIWLAQGTQEGVKLNLSALDREKEAVQLTLYGKKEVRKGPKDGAHYY